MRPRPSRGKKAYNGNLYMREKENFQKEGFCSRTKRESEKGKKKEKGGGEGRGREIEKVIKEIMDGSLRELQRTNSHFQFASG